MTSPKQPELRGTCEKAAKELAEQNPDLTVVRGWYNDTFWGPQEHWWCVSSEGEIVDPTVEQFPTGHIPALRSYTEYTGVLSCEGCGRNVEEADSYEGYCCGGCYGNTVGLPTWCKCRDKSVPNEDFTFNGED